MKTILLLALLCYAQLAQAQVFPGPDSPDRGRKHSGIAGQSVIYSCPVGGPFECPPHSYQTRIAIYSDRGRLVKRVRTDEHGLFAVKLAPGTYTLVPAVPPEDSPSIYPYAEPVTVEVEPRQFTVVVIAYDSGVF